MTGTPSDSHFLSFSGPGLLPASKKEVLLLTEEEFFPPWLSISVFISSRLMLTLPEMTMTLPSSADERPVLPSASEN